jgi:endonuclease YncB( thermonuclease family)
VVRALLVTAILSLVLGTAQAAEWVVEGRVVGVTDGDTLTVLNAEKKQRKVRVNGIDAPREGAGVC